MQDTLLKVSQRSAPCTAIVNPRGHLTRIATNLWLDARRRRAADYRALVRPPKWTNERVDFRGEPPLSRSVGCGFRIIHLKTSEAGMARAHATHIVLRKIPYLNDLWWGIRHNC